MPRPIHVEIHAADPRRAIAFYSGVFGWTFTQRQSPQDYWLIKTGELDAPGINGGLLPRHGAGPLPMQAVIGNVGTIDVFDLDATFRRARELGATIALPKMAAPAMVWAACLHDTEQNILGVMQADANAK